MRTQLPGKAIFLLPWIVRTDHTAPDFEARRNLLFVGGFAHRPNVDAILHFARHLWPAVRERLPGATLRIVGSHLSEAVRALDGGGVEIVGHVARIRDELDRARIAIAPLRWARGDQGKGCDRVGGRTAERGEPYRCGRHGPDQRQGLLDRGCATSLRRRDRVGFIIRPMWRLLSRNGLMLANREWSHAEADRKLGALLQATGIGPSLALSDVIEAGQENCRVACVGILSCFRWSTGRFSASGPNRSRSNSVVADIACFTSLSALRRQACRGPICSGVVPLERLCRSASLPRAASQYLQNARNAGKIDAMVAGIDALRRNCGVSDRSVWLTCHSGTGS